MNVLNVTVRVHCLVFPAVHVNDVKIYVEPDVASVIAVRGDNVTLPCRFWYQSEPSLPKTVRIKWSWFSAAEGQETLVLVAIGSRSRSVGEFRLIERTTKSSISFHVMVYIRAC